MTGPYETEQQVRELPAVRAIHEAMHASHRRGETLWNNYKTFDHSG